MKTLTTTFSEFSTCWLPRIEERLEALVPECNGPQAKLFEAVRYALLGNAKRLRPLIVLAAAETLGCSPERALDTACALEMIHTYSLVHDDLPCMDDDDLRRGKATTHKVYGESTAVLVGDFLLTQAFEVITDADGLSEAQKVQLIKVMAAGAGGHGMIGGQHLDLAAEGKALKLECLQGIHRMKTAALFVAALVMGGIVANAPETTLEALRGFGQHLGIAFQIQDDILDATSTDQILGKPAGSDDANDKPTFVSLFGLEKATICLQEHTEKALQHLPSPAPLLQELVNLMTTRNK